MSQCKHCGVQIGWKRVGGNWRPVGADGLPHRCLKPEQNFPVVIPGKRIVGEHYKPSCGECGLPPWETCACSFPKSCAASAP